jgi:hypothetical protein
MENAIRKPEKRRFGRLYYKFIFLCKNQFLFLIPRKKDCIGGKYIVGHWGSHLLSQHFKGRGRRISSSRLAWAT